jgi:hypothetical protein
MLIVSALPSAAGSEEEKFANLPNDVVALIGRRASCAEWTAKARAAHEYAADIRRILSSLQCDIIARDEARLRQKYRFFPGVLRELDGKWVRVVRRLERVLAPVPIDGDR